VADRGLDALYRGALEEVVANLSRRRVIAEPHARRAHHAHPGTELGAQIGQELLAAEHGTGEAVAHPNGERGDFRRALLHDVEVRVERGRLVDLGIGEAHLFREPSKVGCGDLPVVVLDAVQVLDQQLPVARSLTEQRPHFIERLGIDLASFGN
jgi:hypothetical protein